MNTPRIPILSLIFATSVLCAEEPAKPLTNPDAMTELKGASAPYYAALESVSADCQKWLAALETSYLAGLDKLKDARAKAGDLDGAVAIKAEQERFAAHAATTAEQIQAMPAALRTLRATYDQGVKRIADEGRRRMDLPRRKHLADLDALQKRITISGDIDQALLVKAEKERFIAEMTAVPLKTALLESKWTWVAARGERNVVMTFHEDGTVNHRGMSGTWKITGPRDVKITTNGTALLLQFDQSLRNYKRLGGDEELHGSRVP